MGYPILDRVLYYCNWLRFACMIATIGLTSHLISKMKATSKTPLPLVIATLCLVVSLHLYIEQQANKPG